MTVNQLSSKLLSHPHYTEQKAPAELQTTASWLNCSGHLPANHYAAHDLPVTEKNHQTSHDLLSKDAALSKT
jgi:hypothetical protein